tara:strand:+ start:612 stop:938 length:327 start_codon:yes stop_codon:yes gene_type:complete
MDHNAILKAYPSIKIIDDSFINYGLDDNGNKVSIDQSKVDEARATLNAEAAAVKYQTDRTTNGSKTYSAIGDQLDLLWHAIDADADLKVKFSAFYNSIKAVKDANPKP